MARMIRPRLKRRGYHETGRKRYSHKPSEDLCPYCFSFGCDPTAMSLAFRHKIDERLRKKLCPCCGKPKAFCTCRSSEKIKVPTMAKAHNNRKLRKAIQTVKDKETAYTIWDKNENILTERLGKEIYTDIHYELYRHNNPKYDWQKIFEKIKDLPIDKKALQNGWIL